MECDEEQVKARAPVCSRAGGCRLAAWAAGAVAAGCFSLGGASMAEEGQAPDGRMGGVAEQAAFSTRYLLGRYLVKASWLSNGYHAATSSRATWSSTDCVNWTLVSDKTPYDGYSEMVVFQEAVGDQGERLELDRWRRGSG